ncbi:MAG TPA: hypothetical protein PLP27_05370 [Crocinitomicaceae bacterium]|nr:hypothetical protein [Crocinitomicaceae bacterium]
MIITVSSFLVVLVVAFLGASFVSSTTGVSSVSSSTITSSVVTSSIGSSTTSFDLQPAKIAVTKKR